MDELRPGRFGLVKKVSDGFRRTKNVIPAKESIVKEAVEGIEFGLLVLGAS